MEPPPRHLTHDDYTVACICPMGVELAPVEAMLDEIHQSLPTSLDKNSYTLGRIGVHNVVIAVMPEIGNSSAAKVATQLLNDFSLIRFGLLVGIGGGIPSDNKDDIRLGDVVVSKPTATFGGVVQFDTGKILPNGQFERTGTLKKPPAVLMANVQRLEARHRRIGNQIFKYLSEMLEKFPNMEEEYVCPGIKNDQLFEATYNHKDGKTCRLCDWSKVVERAPRKNSTPKIHYGTIGSANEVIKDSKTRDRLRTDLGILCVEMEAAGLMGEFSCLVIRGICDYADSHKNKIWQPYAAATAAAYAKELLSIIPAQEVIATTNAVDVIREQDRLRELPYADGAAFNSRIWEHEPRCLPETRVDLLEDIMIWSRNHNSTCIFWLNGMAGTGKSTIARTVAHKLNEKEYLGASFYFSRGQGNLGHAGMLFTTLAAQLANNLPALRPFICRAIAEKFNISQQGLAEQWKHLIFQPLSNLNKVLHQSQIFGLVIDALDECEGEEDIRLILRLLAQAKTLEFVQLRVFVTSRPETPIRLGFHNIPEGSHQDCILHNISPSIVDYDISTFYRHELQTAWKKCNLPEQQTIELLVKKAGGLFIWAATACRFINDGKRFTGRRLSLILQGDTTVMPPEKKLDEIYITILTHSISGSFDEYEREELWRLFKEIVGSIIVLIDPLSAVNLAKLLGKTEEEIYQALDDLHSVLEVPESPEYAIRFLHTSFRDFLLGKERCRDQRFWVDERKAHEILAQSCLRVMFNSLRRDICGLRTPGTFASVVESSRIEQYLPPDLQYACRYWFQHLQQSEYRLVDDCQVHKFLQEHFLHWLEALSLLGKLPEGIVILTALQSMLTSDKHPELWALVHDERQFVLSHRYIIGMAPLQVYYSALIFSPARCLVRKHFLSQMPTWIKTFPVVEDNWSDLSKVEGNSDTVWAVAFSPNGRLVASGSGDGIVRLWDVATGATVQRLEGHSDWVRSVAFSPDGQLVASGSCDGTVRLWDITTGDLTKVLNCGYFVGQLSFSQDGSYLETDREHIPLGLPTHHIPTQHNPLYSLDKAHQWVTWNSHNIVFLPPYRRSYDFAVKGNILVIAHASGRLTYFEFNPDIRPLLDL